MNFSSLQENLKQGLFFVGHVAGKNINLPILNNVMIRAKKDGVKLISTNLEMGITHNIRGKIEKEGEYTVDSKLITDYVGLLPNQKVNISQKEANIIIVCGNYNTKIKGQPTEEFPLIPTINKNKYYSLKINEFKKALSQVVFAVSTNESRMELSGVYFAFSNSKLILASTDSYRLAEKEINIKSSENGEDLKIIVPAKTLQELIRILSGVSDGGDVGSNNEEIKFYVSDNQILFTIKSTEMISRLIEGQYPDYKQIIPGTSKTTAIINKLEFIRAVKASSLFSKSGINDINLDFPANKNQVVISSASGQTGESYTILEAKINGEDNGIIVNYNYLLDGLNNIEGENVRIEIIDNNTPCILRPEKDKDYLYIIMPIKQ